MDIDLITMFSHFRCTRPSTFVIWLERKDWHLPTSTGSKTWGGRCRSLLPRCECLWSCKWRSGMFHAGSNLSPQLLLYNWFHIFTDSLWLQFKFCLYSVIFEIQIKWETNKQRKRSIQRTQTPPCLWPLTLTCDLDLTSSSRKLMLLDVAYCIVRWYQVWCLWI